MKSISLIVLLLCAAPCWGASEVVKCIPTSGLIALPVGVNTNVCNATMPSFSKDYGTGNIVIDFQESVLSVAFLDDTPALHYSTTISATCNGFTGSDTHDYSTYAIPGVTPGANIPLVGGTPMLSQDILGPGHTCAVSLSVEPLDGDMWLETNADGFPHEGTGILFHAESNR